MAVGDLRAFILKDFRDKEFQLREMIFKAKLQQVTNS